MQDQLAKDQYDLLANLALLKLYQFNPTLCSPTAVLSILFLSLAHAPFSPDFTLAWSLLSDSFVVGGPLPPPPPSDDDDDEDELAPPQPHGERETADALRELSALLLARKFRLFWAALRTPAPTDAPHVRDTITALLASATGFEARVRESISQEIEPSFKGLSRKMLESFLGLEGASFCYGMVCSETGGLTFARTSFQHSRIPCSRRGRRQARLDPRGRRRPHPREREQLAHLDPPARAHLDRPCAILRALGRQI